MASCTAISDSVSSAEVASSRIRIGASLYSARAMARRWRWPPDNCMALWPSTVSSPSGSPASKDERLAASRHSLTRSASTGWPRLTLSAMLLLSITTCWLTTANCERRQFRSQLRISSPSRVIRPSVISTKRGNRFTKVVLPEPDAPTMASVSPAETDRLKP